MRFGEKSVLREYALAVLAVAAATLLRFLLTDLLRSQPFPTFFLAITIVAMTCGAGPTLFAAALSAVTASFFFIKPTGDFRIESELDLTRIAIFLVLSAGMAALAEAKSCSRQVAMDASVKLGEARSQLASKATLQGREAFFRGVLDSLPHEIAVIDKSGLLLAINRRWERFAEENCGVEVKVSVGANYLAVCSVGMDRGDAYARAAFDGLNALLDGRQDEFVMEYPCHGPRQERWFMMHAARFDAAPAAIVISHTNITERVQAETRLRAATKRLHDADQIKDRFLATLAHELRNPLAPIRTAAFTLRRFTAPGKAAHQEKLLSMIDRQVDHLIRIVDDLLDVSRITRGVIGLKRARVDLSQILNHAAETAQSTIDHFGHHLYLVLPSKPLSMEVDQVRLTQVFTNLLINAGKYTESGGVIWVTAARQGDDAVVIVRDNGVGIAPDLLPRVFDLFTQAGTTYVGGGLGIGLTLVKNLVELHGGRVEAHSLGLGRGSVFVVRLPMDKTT